MLTLHGAGYDAYAFGLCSGVVFLWWTPRVFTILFSCINRPVGDFFFENRLRVFSLVIFRLIKIWTWINGLRGNAKIRNLIINWNFPLLWILKIARSPISFLISLSLKYFMARFLSHPFKFLLLFIWRIFSQLHFNVSNCLARERVYFRISAFRTLRVLPRHLSIRARVVLICLLEVCENDLRKPRRLEFTLITSLWEKSWPLIRVLDEGQLDGGDLNSREKFNHLLLFWVTVYKGFLFLWSFPSPELLYLSGIWSNGSFWWLHDHTGVSLGLFIKTRSFLFPFEEALIIPFKGLRRRLLE